MVELRDLQKKYRNFSVLKGLDMTINKGDVYGFIGRNGCGKTTTMNILCNIIPKDSGSVVLGGGEKIRIGYLPETPALFPYMNGYEYLDYIAACGRFAGDIKARTREVLEVVGMAQGALRRIKGYSRGMNQRLGIAAAIYHDPDLLILDEPTSALDPEGRAEVMSIITRLTETGSTILLCTHILSDIERVASRVGILADGVMKDEGTVAEVIKRHTQGHAVVVKLFEQNPEKIALLKACSLVEASEIDTVTGAVTLHGASSEALSGALLKTMAESGLVPESMSVVRADLEKVYLQIAGKAVGR